MRVDASRGLAMIRMRVRKSFREPGRDFAMALDLEVPAQQFVNLYGRSGAGKTTTLRMLAGLTDPDEGRIEVDGEVWFDSARGINRAPQARSIGFVFQDYALFPNMTVRRNLEFAAGRSRDPRIIDAMLAQMGLSTLSESKPVSLSGGQKQRLALARAMVRRPKILLLDEPLSALDSETRVQMQDAILGFHRQFDLTSILVSHHLSEIFRMCHRMVVMDAGRIIKSGPPSEVLIARKMSGKFKFEGEILEKQKSDTVHILTVAIGGNMVKVIATEAESSNLQVGQRILVASKAFNPILIPLENPPPDSAE